MVDSSDVFAPVDLDFDRRLTREWDLRYEHGVIRYGLDGLARRRAGRLGAQFNPGRSRKERNEDRPMRDANPVFHAFGNSRYDFLRILANDPSQRLFGVLVRGRLLQFNVNWAPVLPYHFLVVPDPESKKPQFLDAEAVYDALDVLALSSSPNLYLGFNSRGSWASVNHLHFQAVYYPEPKMNVMAYPREILLRDDHVQVETADGYPLRCFCILAAERNALVDTVMQFVESMQQANTPHTLIVTRREVWVFPKERSRGMLSGTGSGFFESGGEIIVDDQQVFRAVDEDRVHREIELGSVDADRFAELATSWSARS